MLQVILTLAVFITHTALADPTITAQPVGGQAATNESFAFNVQAAGSGTLTYQWLRNSSSLNGETNAALLLTNITSGQAGAYAVRVTDSSNSVTSSNAFLTVNTQPRKLATGVITGGAQAQLEILLSANGRENSFEFSLGFLTNTLTNPVFTSAFPSATTTVNTSQAAAGIVGVTMELPTGQMFTNGLISVGSFNFDFVSGSNPFAAGFYFTNTPTDLKATDTNGQALVFVATVLPSARSLGAPILNLQSGLFQEQVVLGNGGPQLLTNVQVLVYGLGYDSKTNAIKLFNAQTSTTLDWNVDGVNEILPLVQVVNLTNGESRQLTLEYYVSDHVTTPTSGLLTLASGAWTFTAPTGNALAITRSLYTNGVFLIEFNTKTNGHYYIQYAATPGELMNNATVKTAFPSITGTGSRVQWIDNGPPKTDSPPTDGSRFYRVWAIGQ